MRRFQRQLSRPPGPSEAIRALRACGLRDRDVAGVLGVRETEVVRHGGDTCPPPGQHGHRRAGP